MDTRLFKRPRKTFKNLDSAKKYINKVQNEACEKNHSYVCKINDTYILIEPIEERLEFNPTEIKADYYFNIFRTMMLGKLASACYYEQHEEEQQLRDFLLNYNDLKDSVGFKKLVNNICKNKNNVVFSPIPNLSKIDEKINFSNVYATSSIVYAYNNYDGIDLVSLPYKNLPEFDILPAYLNGVEAIRKNYLVKSFSQPTVNGYEPGEE